MGGSGGRDHYDDTCSAGEQFPAMIILLFLTANSHGKS